MEGKDMKTFINMLKDDSGASAAEYALILAIIGTGIALAAMSERGPRRLSQVVVSPPIASAANSRGG